MTTESLCCISSLHWTSGMVWTPASQGILAHDKIVLLYSIFLNWHIFFYVLTNIGFWCWPLQINQIFFKVIIIHILLASKADLKHSLQKICLAGIWSMWTAINSPSILYFKLRILGPSIISHVIRDYSPYKKRHQKVDQWLPEAGGRGKKKVVQWVQCFCFAR